MNTSIVHRVMIIALYFLCQEYVFKNNGVRTNLIHEFHCAAGLNTAVRRVYKDLHCTVFNQQTILMVSFLLFVTSLYALCPGAIQLIKFSEGFEKCVGPDPIGIPTVAYGHKCQPNDPYCARNRCFTEAQATALLFEDLKQFQSCVRGYLGPLMNKFTKAQFAALVSFTFNLGCGTLQGSTMLKRLGTGENPNQVIPQEFPKFIYGGGVVQPGLVTRRKSEVDLFLGRGQYASNCR
jgi:GH24 family phage-related lysozyme (muramidase)